MRIAPEGRPFILGAWGIALALGLVAPAWFQILWLPIAIWVTAFFRDPVRRHEGEPESILAPADGQVVSVVTMHEPTFLNGSATRVSIFMNVFNVHVNRYPTDGTVIYRLYRRGRFVNAAAEKASLENEQMSIGLETPHGRVLVRQIAGLVARRIVTDHAVDTEVHRGERLGLIRFGSRVDLFLPPQAVVTVAPGSRTLAGQTAIGYWNVSSTA